MQRASMTSVLALALCSVLLTGCPETNSLDTEMVTGTVTLDGEPVEGATVNFNPVDPEQGMPAFGMTDENGVYTLTATGEGAQHGKGTLPGEYKVTVTKNIAETPMSAEEAEEAGVEYTGDRGAPQAPEIEYVVPRKYNMQRSTPLSATVTEGENTIDLKLTSD